MNRARKPVPSELRGLHFNSNSGRYEYTENGITYAMEYIEMVLLKDGIKVSKSVEEWYNNLDKAIRKRIIRTGDVLKSKADFFPDYIPEG